MSNPKEKPFTVFDTKTERGRIALANHDMHPGDLLLAARPYASVIKKEHRTQYCNFCWKKKQADANLLRCSKCKSVYYCSKECQVSITKQHKNQYCDHQHHEHFVPFFPPLSKYSFHFILLKRI